MDTLLTFVEEVYLLSLDGETGKRLPSSRFGFGYVLAGAVLSDLAWANRIDTDPQSLVILDGSATGNPILDRALAKLSAAKDAKSVLVWLRLVGDDARRIEEAVAEQLVARGILRRHKETFLWIFDAERFPTADERKRIEVKQRLSELIASDELPEPRDATLLSLLVACEVAQRIFPEALLRERAKRIETLIKLDLVGREVGASFRLLAEV